LKNFGPNLKVLESGFSESSYYSVCNVSDSRLKREKRRRKATSGDFIFEELDQVASNLLRVFTFSCVVSGVVRSVGLDDCDDSCGVDRDGGCTDAVGRFRD
jgi:hypothetical protein